MANDRYDNSGWALFGKVIGILMLIAMGIGAIYWAGAGLYNMGYDQSKRDGEQAVQQLELEQRDALAAKDKVTQEVGVASGVAHLVILKCLQDDSCKKEIVQTGVSLNSTSLVAACLRTPDDKN
ncbi:MAG: hypothetical protein Q8P82_00165, partial [bacterium]|nr:hypothetical protein [bacterium]